MDEQQHVEPKFDPGQIVATKGAVFWVHEVHDRHLRVTECLSRHLNGDWGDVPDEDKALNDAALAAGDRLLSVYTVDGEVIWVITEADRSVTTVLFPSEY